MYMTVVRLLSMLEYYKLVLLLLSKVLETIPNTISESAGIPVPALSLMVFGIVSSTLLTASS